MRKIFKSLLSKNKIIISIYFILIIFYAVTFGLFAKNILALTGVESVLRYIILGLLFIYLFIYIIKSFKKISRGKNKKFFIYSGITLIISIIMLLVSMVVGTVYSSISNIGESDTLNYTSKLIRLIDADFDSESKIGMIASTDDIEGYVLSNIIMVNEDLDNEIIYYESYIKMLYDLYSGEIDAAFVQNNYVSLYESEENLEDLYYDTEVIYSFSASYENDDKVESTNKTFDEPLTFLVMGVDSTVDGLDDSAAFNGDTLMLITFNPDTLNATMFSIPRDLMVPISCNNNSVAKINSAAAYGTSCVIDTVENLTGIEIDYYIKINFQGAVDLVDALGGIEVDVEEPDYDTYDGYMCEQDSQRRFGDYLICLWPGLQTLDGEEALAYARNRKLYLQSDISRIAHQQQVVEAIANKALSITSYSVFEAVLDAVENNIVTNMSTEQILSSYTVLKSMISSAVSGDELINIEKSYLEYYDLRVYMSSYGYETAGLGYYEDSLNDIIEMMEINLGIKEEEIIKTFSFKNGEVYEQTVAGEDYYGSGSYSVLKDFVGTSQSSAESYCSLNGITCEFITVDSSSEYYNSSVSAGLIANQSVIENTLMTLVNTVTLYINGFTVTSNEDEEDSSEDLESEADDEVDDEVDEIIDNMIASNTEETDDEDDSQIIIENEEITD